MKSKIGALLFCGMFAIAFSAGGFFAGILPLAQMMHAVWKARAYVPVPAEVVVVSLESGSKGTKAVRARYRYRFDGKTHESSRVGLLGWGKDNVGDWHDDWYARLQDVKRNNAAITAWVDPERPQEAVLDRSLRWGLVLLLIPFATLFSAIGLGAAYVFVKMWQTPADRIGEPAKRGADASDSLQAAIRARRAAAGPDWSAAGRSPDLAFVQIPAKAMRVAENDGGWSAVFPNMGARLAGVFWLLPSAGAFSMARKAFLGRDAADAAWTLAWLFAACATAALSLHFFTRTWKLVVTPGGIELRRDSLLRPRRMHVAREDIAEFVKKVCGRVEGNTYSKCYYQIYARTRDGRRVQLTPGIDGETTADAVAYRLDAAKGGFAHLSLSLPARSYDAAWRRFLGIFVAVSLCLIIAGAVGLQTGYRPGDPLDGARIMREWEVRLERLGINLAQIGAVL